MTDPGAPVHRGFLHLAAACILTGAVAWAWELLALQAPSSPWHVQGFPLAIERLALHAWIIGLAVLVLTPRAPARRLLGIASLGALLSLGAHAFSAATGLLGIQLRDARSGAALVLAARLTGATLLLAALAIALVLRTRPGPPPP